MAVLYIILRNDAVVGNSLLVEEIHRIGLLQESVTNVLLIGKNLFQRTLQPVGISCSCLDTVRFQALSNLKQACAIQILSVNSHDDLRFFRDDDQISFIILCIAKEAVVIDLHFSCLVAELQSQFYILGKGLAFLLCKGCHDGQKDFALGIHRIDVLFFKVHGNVLFLQFPDVFQAIQSVAGKSADGLGNDHVDFGCHAVLNHAVKLFTLLGVCA